MNSLASDNIRRISALHIADSVNEAGDIYRALGFALVKTVKPEECTGWMSSDGSGIIISATAMIARDFGETAANSLAGKSIPYVFVHDIEKAKAMLRGVARMVYSNAPLSDVTEVLITINGQSFMLAQKKN